MAVGRWIDSPSSEVWAASASAETRAIEIVISLNANSMGVTEG